MRPSPKVATYCCNLLLQPGNLSLQPIVATAGACTAAMAAATGAANCGESGSGESLHFHAHLAEGNVRAISITGTSNYY